MHFHAGEFAGVNQHAFLFFVGTGHFFQLQLFANGANGDDLVDAIFISKHPVALVAGGHAHNSAGTIIIEYIIRYPDRYLLSVYRVYCIDTGEHTLFLGISRGTLNITAVLGLFDESTELLLIFLSGNKLFYKWMLCGKNNISHTKYSMGTGSVNRNLLTILGNIKGELQTFTAANPVILHCLYAIRPALQQRKILLQFISIGSNLKEPLRQCLFTNIVVTAPALAIDYLLISQNSSTGIAPVYRGFLLVRKTTLVEGLKHPLSPAVVIGTAGLNLSVPIIRKTHFPLLTLHVVNIREGPIGRADIILYGSIFCRHTESIKTHRVNNIETGHCLITSQYITYGIIAYMSHMEISRRIREHLQNIVLLFILGHLSLIDIAVSPLGLPFFLYIMRFILQHFSSPSQNDYFLRPISTGTRIICFPSSLGSIR